MTPTHFNGISHLCTLHSCTSRCRRTWCWIWTLWRDILFSAMVCTPE